ncbi:MAG: hypothetical protein ACC662_00070 [Planctomycetota bacterium]
MSRIRRLLFPLALAVLAGTFASPELADDLEDAKALAARIDQVRKAKDQATLTTEVGRVPALYKAITDKSVRGKLRGALGKVVKDKKMGSVRITAVEALVGLDDPKAAWKEMARELPGPKVEEAPELGFAVVKAAGEMAPSRAIKGLLELMSKSKDPKLMAAAGEALGGYRADKRNRVSILEEMISAGRRLRPGRSLTKYISPETRKRWSIVAPKLVKGLNRLTGQRIPSFEDWEALYNDNKKRLKNLFLEED